MNHEQVTHSKHIARSSLLNIATSIATSILAIAFVPIVLHRFGTEFYGILSVTWMVLANFNFLDFGFSRASARYVAQELANGCHEKAALWTWTAVFSQGCLGVVAAILIYCFAPMITDRIHVQPADRMLSILALRFFAFSIPLDFANRSLSGVMQAGQRFDWLNGLSILSTLSTYAAYGVGILRGNDFATVVYGLFALRVVNLLGAYYGATRVLPTLLSLTCLKGLSVSYWTRAKAMIQYGWWVAAAAIVAPLLGQFDQWMVSVLIGVALLPYYTVPSNLLWRLGFLPSSLSTPLFPAFSAMEAKTEWHRLENYFIKANRYLLTVIVPILFVLFLWGGEILRIWVGPAFAKQATLPLKLLIPGFLLGLVAPLCGTLLEAVGRPDILVKLYLAELPFNVLSVWLLTKEMGVAGAALSYSVRTIVETLLLWIIVYKVVPFPKKGFLKKGVLPPLAANFIFLVPALVIRRASVVSVFDVSLTIAALLAYGLFAYKFILDGEDRSFTTGILGSKTRIFMERIGLRRLALSTADDV